MNRRRLLQRIACVGPSALIAPSVLGLASLLNGCATHHALQTHAKDLAPRGELRVGVYLGSPTSLVRDAAGVPRGLSVELGQRLALELGVPYKQVEYPRLALVLEALKVGEVDFTITNATAVRARDMDFSDPLVALELGLLVMPTSPITRADSFDLPGRRIGVAQGSSSQATLTERLKQATVVPAASLQAASEQLKRSEIDAFATNKAILFEMADGLPGSRVLEGRWGTEHLAMAIPKGRGAALDALRTFAARARSERWVDQAAQRAGLRGTAPVAQ